MILIFEYMYIPGLLFGRLEYVEGDVKTDHFITLMHVRSYLESFALIELVALFAEQYGGFVVFHSIEIFGIEDIVEHARVGFMKIVNESFQ